MTVQSNPKKKRRESHLKFKSLGNHEEFLERITKTLYYAELPSTERFSLPLSELAVELYSEVKCGKSLERLTLEDASEISRNACISPCSLVLAMLYLEQLKTTNPNYVDRVTPSDLFVISLMVASKFLNDSGEEDDVLNSEWAVSAGLSLSELNKLEMGFLNAIDWKIFIMDGSFWEKLRSIETKLSFNEGKKRGWFSYTELESLLDQVNAYLLAQAVFTVSAVCLASYAAGMLTVIGSTMVATRFMYIPPSQHKLLMEFSTDLTRAYSHELWSDPPDIHIEEQLFNRSLDSCLENPLSHDFCGQPDLKKTESLTKENISFLYKNILVPISSNLISFPLNWKQPPLHIFSE